MVNPDGPALQRSHSGEQRPTPTPGQRVGTWFDAGWKPAAQGLLALTVLVAGAGLGSFDWWSPYWLLCLVLGGGAIALQFVVRSRDRLEASERAELVADRDRTRVAHENLLQEAEQYCRNVLKVVLRQFIDELRLGDNARVSVYRYDEANESFILLARESSSPTLKRPGRERYPAHQGCIGRAWAEGPGRWTFPDPLRANSSYTRMLVEQFGFDEQTVTDLTMASRCIVAKPIADPVSRDRAGIIVMESVEQDGVPEKEEVLRVWQRWDPTMARLLTESYNWITSKVDPDTAEPRGDSTQATEEGY